MLGTDMPVTPEAIRSRFLTHQAAKLVKAERDGGSGDPKVQKLAALLIRVERGEGDPEVRVRCFSGPGTGMNAVITAGLRIDSGHLPAHPLVAYGPTSSPDPRLKAHEWIKQQIWRKDPALSRLVVDRRVPVRWETDPGHSRAASPFASPSGSEVPVMNDRAGWAHATSPAELLTTESIINPLLDALDPDQLSGLAARIRTRRVAQVEARLLDALREDSAQLHSGGLTDHPEPVTHVTFSTHSNDYDPVCWDDNAVARHTTGATTNVDYAGARDVEGALRDYSGFTDPVEGTRLVVDLITGQFTVRGPWEPGLALVSRPGRSLP